MHIYIYDSYVNEKKYDNILARVETRITDLGLNGKIIRLGIMSSVYDTIENEILKGAKTIVGVGDNSLLNQIINSMASQSKKSSINKKVPVGFIPIGSKNNEISDYFGIDGAETACNILSARRVIKFDLGKANGNYFLTQATITTEGTKIEIDKNYSIEITEKGEVGVVNLPLNIEFPKAIKSSATDNILELYIKTRDSKKYLPINFNKFNQSVFSFKKLNIINAKKPLILDSSIKIATPAEISIAKEKINLIVGRKRNF